MISISGALKIDYLACGETDLALKRHFGVESERDLLDRLHSDFYYLPMRDLSQNEGYKLVWKKRGKQSEKTRLCPLGIGFLRGAYDNKFMVDEAISHPLENASSVEDILCYPFPKASEFDFSPLADYGRSNAGRLRVGGLWTGILGDSYRMVGFEKFLYNLCAEPELSHALIRRMTDMYLELNEAYFTAVKGDMDIWFFGNDFGSQMGLLMSRKMWREYFYSSIAELCALAHSHGLMTMMHSCGGIEPIIQDLIEAGVDIIDPVQVTARGMSPQDLGAKYGGKIWFHGGIDTQQVLPRADVDTVRRHVREVADAFMPCYIFAPSQILGADIPVANIIAAYEEAERIKNSAVTCE